MKLRDLLRGLEQREIQGQTSMAIEGIAYDSRRVERSFLFVAMKGQEADGHDYIEEAIECKIIKQGELVLTYHCPEEDCKEKLEDWYFE